MLFGGLFNFSSAESMEFKKNLTWKEASQSIDFPT
jgi:hypothetical protein